MKSKGFIVIVQAIVHHQVKPEQELKGATYKQELKKRQWTKAAY